MSSPSILFKFILVCAFPYILGFSENSIEIRLMVNGNLVHTHCVPHMKLITAKVTLLEVPFYLSIESFIPPNSKIKTGMDNCVFFSVNLEIQQLRQLFFEAQRNLFQAKKSLPFWITGWQALCGIIMKISSSVFVSESVVLYSLSFSPSLYSAFM